MHTHITAQRVRIFQPAAMLRPHFTAQRVRILITLTRTVPRQREKHHPRK